MDIIIDAGLAAPSAINSQSVHLWVVQDKEYREELKKCCKFTFNAPCIMVMGYDPELSWVRGYDDKDEGEVDTAIFATSILMQIADLGLGGTYVGDFDPATLEEILPMTKGYEVVCMIPCGYPAGGPSIKHADRKRREDRVTFI